MATEGTTLERPSTQTAAVRPSRQGWTAPWWLYPATVVVGLGLFSIYGLWTSLIGGTSSFGPYLSPFYSPQIWTSGPVSPALWVLWIPLSFRATCYYYRKSYHRAFFWDPPACAVPELRKRPYKGETRFPLILSNLHRFTWYLVVIVLGFLWYDVARALIYHGHWYLGLGTGIMLVNVLLLTGYSFGCHSFRHLMGGGLDCYSCSAFKKARKTTWRSITRFNTHHAAWAWASMISVVAVDLYIRLLQWGVFVDPHFLLG